MTLKEFLCSLKGTNSKIRIFIGCMTLFNGKTSKIANYEEWKKVHPYMDCKLLNKCTINEVIVVTI